MANTVVKGQQLQSLPLGQEEDPHSKSEPQLEIELGRRTLTMSTKVTKLPFQPFSSFHT
jgi:hypothetical protein